MLSASGSPASALITAVLQLQVATRAMAAFNARARMLHALVLVLTVSYCAVEGSRPSSKGRMLANPKQRLHPFQGIRSLRKQCPRGQASGLPPSHQALSLLHAVPLACTCRRQHEQRATGCGWQLGERQWWRQSQSCAAAAAGRRHKELSSLQYIQERHPPILWL